jgi:hypothetical protein
MPSRPDPHARLKTIGIAAGAAIVLGVVVLAVVSGDEASRPASAQPAPAINPPPRIGPTREVGAFDGGAVPVPAVLAAIEVIVEPAGAQVTLEGREPAPAPAVFEGLAPGTYRVTVTRNGFIPLERTITVTAGEHRSLDLSMIPVAAPLRPPSSGSRLSPSGLAVKTRPDNRPGQLIVRTVPYSVAYLEGKKFDTTPFTRELKPGRYTMTFRHPKFPPRARTVTIRPGKKTKLVFELK